MNEISGQVLREQALVAHEAVPDVSRNRVEPGTTQPDIHLIVAEESARPRRMLAEERLRCSTVGGIDELEIPRISGQWEAS